MNHTHSTNDSKHMLIMMACCLIPIGLILAVSVFGITLGSLTPLLPYAIVLLCPLLMFFMMRGMGHDHNAAENQPTTALPRSAAPAALIGPESKTASEHQHAH